jgi:hypothetical protein
MKSCVAAGSKIIRRRRCVSAIGRRGWLASARRGVCLSAAGVGVGRRRRGTSAVGRRGMLASARRGIFLSAAGVGVGRRRRDTSAVRRRGMLASARGGIFLSAAGVGDGGCRGCCETKVCRWWSSCTCAGCRRVVSLHVSGPVIIE